MRHNKTIGLMLTTGCLLAVPAGPGSEVSGQDLPLCAETSIAISVVHRFRRPQLDFPQCPDCDYSLIGVESDRCPECGLGIDDANDEVRTEQS